MLQYNRYTEFDKKQVFEIYLNLLKLFHEKQVKQYKGFVPFNLKFYKEQLGVIKNLEFNSIQLRKIKNGLYRFYLSDDEIFTGRQKIIDRKLEREFEIKNYGKHYFDFSISPFQELNNSDERFVNNEISYDELMRYKTYFDLYYYYIPEKMYLTENIETKITQKGRLNDLIFSSINYMNKFQVKCTNLIDNINEDCSGSPFDLIFVSLVNRVVSVYTVSLKEFFDKVQGFDLTYVKKIHNNINIFDKELNEFIQMVGIQRKGDNPQFLDRSENMELIDQKTIEQLRTGEFLLFDNKQKIKFSFSSKYDITEKDNMMLVMPYISYFKNMEVFNPNFLETTPNMRLIQLVDAGSF